MLCLVTNYSHVKFYIELNVYLLCGECDGLSFTKSRGSIKVSEHYKNTTERFVTDSNLKGWGGEVVYFKRNKCF